MTNLFAIVGALFVGAVSIFIITVCIGRLFGGYLTNDPRRPRFY